jgi:hypothetical protein
MFIYYIFLSAELILSNFKQYYSVGIAVDLKLLVLNLHFAKYNAL